MIEPSGASRLEQPLFLLCLVNIARAGKVRNLPSAGTARQSRSAHWCHSRCPSSARCGVAGADIHHMVLLYLGFTDCIARQRVTSRQVNQCQHSTSVRQRVVLEPPGHPPAVLADAQELLLPPPRSLLPERAAVMARYHARVRGRSRLYRFARQHGCKL